MSLRDVRCPGPWRSGWGTCNTLLFRASTASRVEIKCPKCKRIHLFDVSMTPVDDGMLVST